MQANWQPSAPTSNHWHTAVQLLQGWISPAASQAGGRAGRQAGGQAGGHQQEIRSATAAGTPQRARLGPQQLLPLRQAEAAFNLIRMPIHHGWQHQQRTAVACHGPLPHL